MIDASNAHTFAALVALCFDLEDRALAPGKGRAAYRHAAQCLRQILDASTPSREEVS